MKVGWVTKLFIYFTIITIAGPFFDNWTTTEKLLFINDSYASKCHESELIGPPTESFRCEKQQLAVSGLLSYARMSEFLASVIIGICVDRFGPMVVAVLGVFFCILSWFFMCLFPKAGFMLKPSMIIIGISTNCTLFPALTIERYTKKYKSQVLIFLGSSSSITCFLIKLLQLIIVKGNFTPIAAVSFFILFLLLPCFICSFLFFPTNVNRDVNKIGLKDARVYPALTQSLGSSKEADSSNLSPNISDTSLFVPDALVDDYLDEDQTNYNEVLTQSNINTQSGDKADLIPSKLSNAVQDLNKDCTIYTETKINASTNLIIEDPSNDLKGFEIQSIPLRRSSFDYEQLETANALQESSLNGLGNAILVGKLANSKFDVSHSNSKWDKVSVSNWDVNRCGSKWDSGVSSEKWDKMINNSLERIIYSRKWNWQMFLKNLWTFDVILCVLYYSFNVVSLTYSQQSYNILYSDNNFLLEFIEYLLPFSFVPCVLFLVITRFLSSFYLLMTVGLLWLLLNLCSVFQGYTAGIFTAILLTISYSIYNTHVYIYLEDKIDKDYASSVIGFLNTVAGLSMLFNIFLISPITDRKKIFNINISLFALRLVFLGVFVYRQVSDFMRNKRTSDKRVIALQPI